MFHAYTGYDTVSSFATKGKNLFTKKGRAMNANPPTRAALTQHIQRAVFQRWVLLGKVSLNLPSPAKWGWTDYNNWKPLWTTIPEANHPGSYCTVAAKKGAEGSASAKEQLWDVLLCVCVVEIAMTIEFNLITF